jgi:hypothetical protein
VYLILPPYLPYQTLSLYPSPHHWYQPPRQNLSSVLKKKAFLFKIAIRGVSLWQFHVYTVCPVETQWASPVRNCRNSQNLSF